MWRCIVARDARGRIETDRLSLIAGLLFLGIAVIYGMLQASFGTVAWALPALLIVVGAVGLAGALPRRRRDRLD